jgi:hypothetical protein
VPRRPWMVGWSASSGSISQSYLLDLGRHPFLPAAADDATFLRVGEPAPRARAEAVRRILCSFRRVEDRSSRKRAVGFSQRLFVNVTGVSAQRSISSASVVARGMWNARRRFRAFFGRHQMPLPSRCSGPMRMISLPRWHVMMPSRCIRTRSGQACACTDSTTHDGHGT